MTDFRPPINSRTNEELIAIKYSSTEFWQQDAIDQAKRELELRKIPADLEKKLLKKWQLSIDRAERNERARLLRNSVEGYTKFEMAEIVFTAPFILLRRWEAGYSLVELNQENYQLKFKQRAWLLLSGVIGWVLFIILGISF